MNRFKSKILFHTYVIIKTIICRMINCKRKLRSGLFSSKTCSPFIDLMIPEEASASFFIYHFFHAVISPISGIKVFAPSTDFRTVLRHRKEPLFFWMRLLPFEETQVRIFSSPMFFKSEKENFPERASCFA